MAILSSNKREIFSLLALVFALATGVIWIRTSTVKDTYLYVQREKEFRKLQEEIQANRVRWLRLTTPKRLEVIAKNLGLGAPELSQVLRYVPDKGEGEDASP